MDPKERPRATHLLANAPMLPGPKRLVRALCPFAHGTEPVVDLLAAFVGVGLECLRGNALLVVPPRGVPFVGVLLDLRVDLRDEGRCEHVGVLGHDVHAVLGRCGEGRGNDDVLAHLTHDAVDRRVHAESLAHAGVE